MGKNFHPSLRLQAKVDLGALKENEVSWLTWIGMVGWMNRAGRMGCVGSCFLGSPWFVLQFWCFGKVCSCICFIGGSGPKLQEINCRNDASKLGFHGWMGAIFFVEKLFSLRALLLVAIF